VAQTGADQCFEGVTIFEESFEDTDAINAWSRVASQLAGAALSTSYASMGAKSLQLRASESSTGTTTIVTSAARRVSGLSGIAAYPDFLSFRYYVKNGGSEDILSATPVMVQVLDSTGLSSSQSLPTPSACVNSGCTSAKFVMICVDPAGSTGFGFSQCDIVIRSEKDGAFPPGYGSSDAANFFYAHVDITHAFEAKYGSTSSFSLPTAVEIRLMALADNGNVESFVDEIRLQELRGAEAIARVCPPAKIVTMPKWSPEVEGGYIAMERSYNLQIGVAEISNHPTSQVTYSMWVRSLRYQELSHHSWRVLAHYYTQSSFYTYQLYAVS